MRAVTIAMANDPSVPMKSGRNDSISPPSNNHGILPNHRSRIHPQIGIIGKDGWGDEAQDHKQMTVIVAPKDRIAKATSPNDVGEFIWFNR
jgi:hypothetical protein